MEKILVETTGNFGLIDFFTGDEAHHNRPSVVRNSTFFAQRAAIGQIKLLSQLKPEATDKDFAKYWEESRNPETKKVDAQLAVQSFLSVFGPEPVSKKGDDSQETGGDATSSEQPADSSEQPPSKKARK